MIPYFAHRAMNGVRALVMIQIVNIAWLGPRNLPIVIDTYNPIPSKVKSVNILTVYPS
jgi:hypothetical protein